MAAPVISITCVGGPISEERRWPHVYVRRRWRTGAAEPASRDGRKIDAPVPVKLAKKDLRPFFHPRSVAMVGCEPLVTQKLGSWPLHNMLLHGASVKIYPVNPRHREIEGFPCYESVSALPAAPDLVLIMVDVGEAPAVLIEATRCGARAAVVFGARSGEAGSHSARPHLSARHLSIAVLGPESNGVCSVVNNVPCTSAPFAAQPDLLRGDIAVISQSGGLISSIVTRLRKSGAGISHTCSVGAAVDIGVGDLLSYLADDAATSAILVYLEGLTDRESFLEGADKAVAAGKHVIVLKAGRTSEGRHAALGHVGALLGSYDAFQALCDQHGIIAVDSFEEFTALPALLRDDRKPGAGGASGPRPSGISIVSGSGGIGVLLADKAAAAGLRLPDLGQETAERIRSAGAAASPDNPLDLTVHDRDLNRTAIRALAADPGIAHIVFGSQYGPSEIVNPIKEALAEVAQSGVGVSVWSAEDSTAHDEPILAAAGIPIFQSAQVLFGCLRKALALGIQPRAGQCAGGHWTPNAARLAEARDLLSPVPSGTALSADVIWRLLSLYEIPAAPEYPMLSAGMAGATADHSLGYPVVAKLSSSSIPHKSQLGLVEVGLADRKALQAAFHKLHAAGERLGATDAVVTIQKMVRSHIEFIMGFRADRESGPCAFVGLGGVLTELLNDIVIAPAPVGASDAQSMIHRLRGVDALLRPTGEAGSIDRTPLYNALTAISLMAVELGDDLEHLEINPIKVLADEVVAVDVLAVRRSRARGIPTLRDAS